jgi:hypothetical protein
VLNPRVAFVVGWDQEITVQFEGDASELTESELHYYKSIYFKKWPDGRARELWPGICYFKVAPKWIRYGDFNQQPPRIVEKSFSPIG